MSQLYECEKCGKVVTGLHELNKHEKEHRMKRRSEVEWFADHMEKVLKQNDHKEGWSQDTNEALLSRLYEEVEELKDELNKDTSSEAIIKEAVDVANFAMMIADNAKDCFGGRP